MKGGVTFEIVSFVSAVTQFLHAVDMRQLARVSRVDRESMDRMWSMAAALLGSTLDKQPGAIIGQVLRGWTLPHCFAYAWSTAVTVCEAYIAQGITTSCKGGSFWTSLGFYASHPSLEHPGSWAGSTFVAFGSYGNHLCHVTLGKGLNRADLDGHRFLESVSLAMGCTAQVSDNWCGDLSNVSIRDAAKGLLHLLIDHGETLEFTCVHVLSNVDSFIALWFQLGAASNLNICSDGYKNEIPTCPQFKKFASQITINHLD